MSRYLELIELITKYDHEYFNLDSPTVPDAEYDRLYSELLAIEEESGFVAIHSPSRRAGTSTKAHFETIRHAEPMRSLNKAYTDEEVLKWILSVHSPAATDRYCINCLVPLAHKFKEEDDRFEQYKKELQKFLDKEEKGK